MGGPTSPELVAELRALVPAVFAAEVEYSRALDLYDGETFEESVRPPATEAQLDALEVR
jgi:hypothetical protein